MSGAVLFGAGLYLAPLLLLALGRGLRKRVTQFRRVFWGAASGYLAGVLVTAIVTVVPPAHWGGGLSIRMLAVHTSMLIGALLGGLAGAFVPRGRSPALRAGGASREAPQPGGGGPSSSVR